MLPAQGSAPAPQPGGILPPGPPSLLAQVLLGLIRGYQLIVSPWLGRGCRFEPSCSRYAMTCVEGHGALRGSLLSAKRLCKCHPFHPGGYDPPPTVDTSN